MILSSRVSTIIKHPDFGDVLKLGKWSLSGIKSLLRSTGVQNLA
jgi:hypothetical protein